MNNFILPDIWYIVVNEENYNIVNKFFKTHHPDHDLYKIGICGRYKSDTNRYRIGQIDITSPIKNYNYDFGIEITFNQFRKYVLNEEIEEYIIDDNYDSLIKLLKKIEK